MNFYPMMGVLAPGARQHFWLGHRRPMQSRNQIVSSQLSCLSVAETSHQMITINMAWKCRHLNVRARHNDRAHTQLCQLRYKFSPACEHDQWQAGEGPMDQPEPHEGLPTELSELGTRHPTTKLGRQFPETRREIQVLRTNSTTAAETRKMRQYNTTKH